MAVKTHEDQSEVRSVRLTISVLKGIPIFFEILTSEKKTDRLLK